MPLDRLIFPSPGVKVAFWKITETAGELMQMYNPGGEEKVFIEGLPGQRQLHYLASRYLVATFYPGCIIEKDSNGKPHLSGSNVHFSWSHSGDYAAVIFSEHGPVGIDIETVGPRILKIENKFCNKADQQHIHRTRHAESLLIIWGAKESMFKWYGLKEVDFRLHMTVDAFDMGEEGRFTAHFHKPEKDQRLLMQYSIADGHVSVWTLEELQD